MKLKIAEVGGKTYAEVLDGKPVFLDDSGKEIAFDVTHTTATIGRLNGEAKAHREAKEAAEAKLKLFEGIEDGEAARKALETVKNLDQGQLVTAGKVQEIKEAAAKAAREQVEASSKASGERIKHLERDLGKATSDLYSEKVGGAFSRSKFIGDKIAIPSDLMQAQFGSRFKVEDGRIVGYDAAGNKIYSLAKPGELAEFDEAIETMVSGYAHRDSILKGAGQSGSGAKPANGSGNGGKGKEMSRAEFNRLDPAAQMKAMTVDRVAVVD